jgi:hypothetical protein
MCLRAEGSRKAQGSIKVTSGACDYDVCLFWEFLANVEKNFFVEKKGNGKRQRKLSCTDNAHFAPLRFLLLEFDRHDRERIYDNSHMIMTL